MNITIQREALLKPLQAVSGVVEKKQTLPILANVLLTIRKGRLFITGTDLEIELIGHTDLGVDASEDSTVTVSARKLFDICRTAPEGINLHLSIEKQFLIVKTESSCYQLNTLPPENFPNLENGDYPVSFTVQQSFFKNLLSKTYFAMGQQDVRNYLNGVFVDINQGFVKCIAADGHRLAISSAEESGLLDVSVKMIIPRKSVLELIRLFNNDDDCAITVKISDNRLRIDAADFIFTSKLISAQYPDYNRLIPKGNLSAVGDPEAIRQALTRAAILSNEKFRGVRFLLDANKLCITASNADQEQAEEAVPLDYSGQKMEIGFNVAYLLDVVSALISTKCKQIRFIFTDSNNGVLIEPLDNDSSRYVVMPMRL
jgi:DNA polymerase-3 subunit beta